MKLLYLSNEDWFCDVNKKEIVVQINSVLKWTNMILFILNVIKRKGTR